MTRTIGCALDTATATTRIWTRRASPSLSLFLSLSLSLLPSLLPLSPFPPLSTRSPLVTYTLSLSLSFPERDPRSTPLFSRRESRLARGHRTTECRPTQLAHTHDTVHEFGPPLVDWLPRLTSRASLTRSFVRSFVRSLAHSPFRLTSSPRFPRDFAVRSVVLRRWQDPCWFANSWRQRSPCCRLLHARRDKDDDNGHSIFNERISQRQQNIYTHTHTHAHGTGGKSCAREQSPPSPLTQSYHLRPPLTATSCNVRARCKRTAWLSPGARETTPRDGASYRTAQPPSCFPTWRHPALTRRYVMLVTAFMLLDLISPPHVYLHMLGCIQKRHPWCPHVLSYLCWGNYFLGSKIIRRFKIVINIWLLIFFILRWLLINMKNYLLNCLSI